MPSQPLSAFLLWCYSVVELSAGRWKNSGSLWDSEKKRWEQGEVMAVREGARTKGQGGTPYPITPQRLMRQAQSRPIKTAFGVNTACES